MSLSADLKTLGADNPIEFRGETTINVELDNLHDTLKKCKDLGYEMLLDVSSLDHMGEEPRFESRSAYICRYLENRQLA